MSRKGAITEVVEIPKGQRVLILAKGLTPEEAFRLGAHLYDWYQSGKPTGVLAINAGVELEFRLVPEDATGVEVIHG